MPSSIDSLRLHSNIAWIGWTTKKNTAAAIATNWITSVMNAPRLRGTLSLRVEP
jgi:hypothetical protein